jgi:hypothetical protein
MAARPALLLTAACLAMAAGGSVHAADRATAEKSPAADERVAEFEPILVTPRVNPLDESRERLRAMMERAPCLGCEAYAHQRDAYDVVRDVIGGLTGFTANPLEVPNPALDERRESRIANEWRVSDYGPEMQAFR